VEQLGETFDFPLAVTIQYADGTTEQVPVVVNTQVHEVTIPVGGVVRRVDTRDDLGLVVVKR